MIENVIMAVLYTSITALIFMGGLFTLGCWLCGGVKKWLVVLNHVYGNTADDRK